MLIPSYNPPIDGLERTFLSSGTSSGVTALTVDNNNSFAINDRIMVGEEGREKTEIVTVTGAVTAGTGLTIGATTFPHEAGEPITRLRYDQVKYYRSTTTAAGTYTLLTTVTIDVDNQDLLTNYDDTTGIAGYFYKISYYNSVSTLESSLSDPILGSGYVRNSVGFMIDEILREVSDEQETLTSRTEILGWFNEVNDDLLLRVKKPYDFLHTRTTASRVAEDASGSATVLAFPSDMWKFDFLTYNFVDSTTTPVTNITYPVRILPLEEFKMRFQNTLFSATSTDNSDQLQFAAIDTSVSKFRIYPPSSTASTNVFYIHYWKKFTQLDSEGDLFETPTPRVYKLFALQKFYLKKSAKDQTITPLANQYGQLYNAETVNLKRAEKKDGGSPQGMKYLPQDFKGNRQY